MNGDRLIERVEPRGGHRDGCPVTYHVGPCPTRPAASPYAVAGTLAEWEADTSVPSTFPSYADLRRAERLGREVLAARARAHAKHGDDSIEGVPADDPGWLAILVEEVGEIAHALTYDSVVSSDETERLRLRREALEGEIVDVLAVASAWLDASRSRRGVPVDTTRSDAEAADDTRPTS